jgi:CheY-like chemotaxis protein
MNENVKATTHEQHLSTILAMISEKLNLLLADDDKDDCLFFKDALEELPVTAELTTVHNGEQLMQLLSERMGELPSVLFLDLNMPRKNGFECLSEIKLNEQFKDLPVIIFSTSFDQDVVNLLYKKGGQYYIRKPTEFSQLKKVILEALTLIAQGNISQPERDHFVLTGQNGAAV